MNKNKTDLQIMISSGDNEGIVAACRHSCLQEDQENAFLVYY
jgi:hypothetical protein